MPADPAFGIGPGIAIFDGGPLDGRVGSVKSDAVELTVVMTDGHQHRYERTERTTSLPDGRLAWVFAWIGRYYGPRL